MTGRQVYSKVLSTSGKRAVVALNRTTSDASITVRFADLGLAPTAAVRDVWNGVDLGTKTTSHTVVVPAGQAVLLTVTGTEAPGTRTGAVVGRQSNRCLDINNSATGNGTQAQLWDCNGQTNQQWTLASDGTIRSVQSGLCVDASNAATANGTKIVLWACGTGDNQKWTLR